MKEFKAGDVVRIKGTTQEMTVEEITPYEIRVVFFDWENKLQREDLKQGALELVNNDR